MRMGGSPQSGIFIAVVGPSGAGKDSLINFARGALAHDGQFSFPQRVITRPADSTETCLSMTNEAFQSARTGGELALHWQAYGLHYGIPAAINAQLSAGQHVIANISRGVIAEAKRAFARTAVVLITAHPDVLQSRLQLRGRESLDAQTSRLLRNPQPDLPVEPDVVVENNAALELAGASFVRGLIQLSRIEPFQSGL